MDFFRGYVKTKNKHATQKFSAGAKLLSLEQVKELDEYAGILSDETVLIDIDNKEEAECVYEMVEKKELPCRIVETTRGLHFYFLNRSKKVEQCYTGVVLACGVHADIKCGLKNSYSILKFDGKEREIIYDKFDDEDYCEVPNFLLPTKAKDGFYGMAEGEGRNSALYAHILRLQELGLDENAIRDVLTLINDYVLNSPLPQRELETIMRDGAFQKPSFMEKNRFRFDEFAKYLLRKYHIIKMNGQLHIYENGVYRSNPKLIENAMIQEIPTLSQANRREVLAYLEVLITKESRQSDARYIAFKNGILDVISGVMLPFTPDLIISNRIDHNYNPDAYCEGGDNLLNKIACGDKAIRALLEEMLGYPMYRYQELRRSFLLLGEKSNGKSTYLYILQEMLGEENTTALDLSELGDRFKTAELFGKMANIGDDIGDEFIANPAVFKKVVSGDRLNAEFKGRDPFDFSNYAKMFFSANNIPRIKDKTGAVLDRLVIVPFNARFSRTDKDYDPYIKHKIVSEEYMEYFIRIGIEGLKRVLTNLAFTECESVKKELEDYDEQNNPCVAYFKEQMEQGKSLAYEQTNVCYQGYNTFCFANGYTPVSNIEFSKQVKRYFGYKVVSKTIGGKSCRVFIPEDETA